MDAAPAPPTNAAGAPSRAAGGGQSWRRQFALGNLRFQMPRGRVMDICIDGVQSLLEGAVFILGPFLIALALAIAGMLSYTFFVVILPMIQEKYAQQGSLRLAMVTLHCTIVIFFLVNILFNYAMCVLTKNAGPTYDRVVRELASVTEFTFPETPAQVAGYRRDFEDRMVLRMRRRRAREADAEMRQARDADAARQQAVASEEGASHTVTQRRNADSSQPATSSAKDNTAAANVVQNTPSTIVRRWMLMTPYEWGFCPNSMQAKPPRSHFDHVTKRLVLNLDHYCPWVFNAVGYLNYRYFVNFLIFVFIGMCYGAMILLEPFLWMQHPDYTTLRKRERAAGHHLTKPHPMLPRREEKMLISLSFMLCLAISFALVLLGGFHIYLTLTAQTTIEFHANWSKRRREGPKFRNPYDQGWRKNWKQVYGDQPWYIAILPSRREPDYLPVPVPGKNTLRRDIHVTDASKTGGDAV